MASWILRNPPQPLWRQFTAKAKLEGWPLSNLITQFAQDYVDGKIRPSAPPPVKLEVEVLPKQCEKCERTFEIHVRSARGFSYMNVTQLDCPYCGHRSEALIPGEIVNVTRTSAG